MFFPYPNDREAFVAQGLFVALFPVAAERGDLPSRSCNLLLLTLALSSRGCNWGVTWADKLICQKTDTAKKQIVSARWSDLHLWPCKFWYKGQSTRQGRDGWCNVRQSQARTVPIIINAKPSWGATHSHMTQLRDAKSSSLVGFFPPLYKVSGRLNDNSGVWPGATPIKNIKRAVCCLLAQRCANNSPVLTTRKDREPLIPPTVHGTSSNTAQHMVSPRIEQHPHFCASLSATFG